MTGEEGWCWRDGVEQEDRVSLKRPVCIWKLASFKKNQVVKSTLGGQRCSTFSCLSKNTTSVPAICFRFEPRLAFGYFTWTALTSLKQWEAQAARDCASYSCAVLTAGTQVATWGVSSGNRLGLLGSHVSIGVDEMGTAALLLFLAATQAFSKIQQSARCPVFPMELQSFQNGGFWKKECWSIYHFFHAGSQAVGCFWSTVGFLGFLQELCVWNK